MVELVVPQLVDQAHVPHAQQVQAVVSVAGLVAEAVAVLGWEPVVALVAALAVFAEQEQEPVAALVPVQESVDV